MKAKKSLGQHFLRSKVALAQIAEAGKLSPLDTVLEIGPGKGALTEGLLASGARVIAVEIDHDCIHELNGTFANEIESGKLTIIAGDIMEPETQKEIFHKKYLGTAPYKLVANIPYYITGMLFRMFLEQLRQPTCIVFLIQKEVAELIMGMERTKNNTKGKEGILSLSIKAYGTPHYVAKVKAEAFAPPPKVDSAIIAIEEISRERLGKLADQKYFAVVKAGLGSRRKMLLGNLAKGLDTKKEDLEKIFIKLSIDPHVRGEDLSFEKWIELTKALALI